MSRHDVSAAVGSPALNHGDSTRCPRNWCTTDHGSTVHDEDEDHRSSGVVVPVVARTRNSTVQDTDIEVGLLSRREEALTWLVLENGTGVHFEIEIDAAKRLIRAINDDATLKAALGLTNF